MLLVGPRVVHLRQFFEKRKYPVVAAGKGVEGMAQLDTSPCDIVVLELNLGDLTATEFLMAARQGHPNSTFLLLDEATKAGQIVKALQAGLDGYLATPPDEDRLFYEVERHLARGTGASPSSPGASAASGFEELSTQTAMQSMAEAAALQAAVADRESQVIELSDQLKQMQDTLRPLRETSKRFDDVQHILSGLIDGPLDVDGAQRLAQQVQLAQVADIELDSLRNESASARDAKARLQAELDDALRKLRQAQNDVPEDKTARVEELEAEVMVLEGRVSAAEESVNEVKEALALSDDDATEARAEVKALQQELGDRDSRVLELELALATARETASTSVATEAVEAERARHAEAIAALRKQHEDELAKLQTKLKHHDDDGPKQQARQKQHDDELAKLQAQLKEATAKAASLEKAASTAQADLESERARAAEDDIRRSAREEDAIADAVGRERERLERELSKAHEAALAAARSGAASDVDARVAKATKDIEARLTKEAAKEAKDAEARFAAEREKLAKDTRNAVDKATDIELQLEEARMRIEFLEENAGNVSNDADERIKKLEAEFKKEKLRLIEERQAAASGSQEAALRMERFVKENAELKRATAELQAMRDGLEARARAADDAAAAAAKAADAAREEMRSAAARTKDALDNQATVEAAMGGVQAHARSLEEELQRIGAALVDKEGELDRLRTAVAEANARIDSLLAAHERALDDQQRQHSALLDERAAANAAALAELTAAHARAVDEARAGTSVDVERMRSDIEALRTELLNSEAARSQQNDELARVRIEAQTVHAQAQQYGADMQSKLQALEPLAAERTTLLERVAEAERSLSAARDELAIAQQIGAQAGAPADSAELESLRQRVAELEAVTSASDPAVLATVRSLVEAIEPLRWGLGSAIDYMYPFEANDQALATHVRNLRLLQATLTRLAAESRASATPGIT